MPARDPDLLSLPAGSPVPGTCADRRVQRPVPEVVSLASGAARGMGLARLGSDCLQQIVSQPERLLADPVAWLKVAADRRVALIVPQAGSPDSLWCCKESVSSRPWVRLISRISSLRAWNAFRQGLQLCQAGISTPQPLAVVSVTRRGVQHEYLLTAAVTDAISLQRWLTDPDTVKNRTQFAGGCHRLAVQLGLELQRLHRHRFDHRDLKATNILLSPDGGVWLIDLDGVRRWPILLRSRRVQNLARLWVGVAIAGRVPATEALRFLFAYLPPHERPRWKAWWRDVAQRAARKIKQLKGKGAERSSGQRLELKPQELERAA